MRSQELLLAGSILLIGSGLASAQSRFDSLGAPTPAPNHMTSPAQPHAAAKPSDTMMVQASKAEGGGPASTTGMAPGTLPSLPRDDITTTINPRKSPPSDIGMTPRGLTPE
jgi:hypothetical protein